MVKVNNPVPKNLQTNRLDDAACITKHTLLTAETDTHTLDRSTKEIKKKRQFFSETQILRSWIIKKTDLKNLVHVESDVVVCQCLVKLLQKNPKQVNKHTNSQRQD